MAGQLIIAQAEIGGGPQPPVIDAVPEAHTEVAADHESDVFPPFDSSTFASQLLWLAITFVAFYLIMARVALPRIGSILEVRRDRIASDIDRAEQLKRESDAAIAAYEKALADARAKSFAIAEESRKRASAAADEQRKAIEADLAAKLAAAERQIAGIKDAALAEVGGIAADVAGAVVEALIGKRATPDEIRAAAAAAEGATP